MGNTRTAPVPPLRPRCAWAGSDPLMCAYHDNEWGVPDHDSRRLWEKLMLDGFQAGLSWRTILNKREAFRLAFQGFDPEQVAHFDDADVERLAHDPGIVRSRQKIQAVIGNAKAYLAMQANGENFSDFVWNMVGAAPIIGQVTPPPAQTELSQTIAAQLKKRGFKFVGPTIVYAWMQACGMVDDHHPQCFRRQDR